MSRSGADQIAARVEGKEDEEQERKAPERGAAVAEEGQRDADDGRQPQHHADIDEDVEEEDAEHTVAVDAPEAVGLSLGQMDEPQDEGQEEQQHAGRAHEALLLADGAEDEVGVLLGHVLQLGLRAVEEALALEASRPDGNLRLVDVIARPAEVLLEPEEHVDTRALVGLQDVVQAVVGQIEEHHGAEGEDGYPIIITYARGEPLPEQVADEQGADDELHPDDVEGDDVEREERGQQRRADAEGHEAQGVAAVAAVDPDHGRREDLYEQQHGVLADGGGRD